MRRINGLVAAAVTLAIAACGDADSQDKSSARGSTGTPASGFAERDPRTSGRGRGRRRSTPRVSWMRRTTSLKSARSGGSSSSAPAVRTTGRRCSCPTSRSGRSRIRSRCRATRSPCSPTPTASGSATSRSTWRTSSSDRRSRTEAARAPSSAPFCRASGDWSRVVRQGANRRLAEGSLASKEAFVDCALKRDELGIVVGFRDGRAVRGTRSRRRQRGIRHARERTASHRRAARGRRAICRAARGRRARRGHHLPWPPTRPRRRRGLHPPDPGQGGGGQDGDHQLEPWAITASWLDGKCGSSCGSREPTGLR